MAFGGGLCADGYGAALINELAGAGISGVSVAISNDGRRPVAAAVA